MTESSGTRRHKARASRSTRRSSSSSEAFAPVVFSDREKAKGKPTRVNLAAAQVSFHELGFAVLEDAIDREVVLELRRAYFERYAGCSEDELFALGSKVGHERWMLSLPFEPPFDHEALIAPKLVYPLLAKLLGDDFMLHSLSAVTSFPGAEHQHVHLDHELLFPEDEAASFALPPYAVTAVIPLADLTEQTGGTSVWPGTHRVAPGFFERMKKPLPLRPQLGSVYLMDYRLLHGGEPNLAQVPRPVLYLVYTRRWFRDACNFERHPPLRAEPEALARVPERLRHLFARVRGGP